MGRSLRRSPVALRQSAAAAEEIGASEAARCPGFRPQSYVRHLFKVGLLAPGIGLAAFAADPEPAPVPAQPWAVSAVNVESGVLWEIGTGTPFAYRLVPTQLSWRSADFLRHGFTDGSSIVIRHRLTLIGTWVENGPEHHYLGVAGSPSLEWWDRSGSWSVFGGVGGGFGVIDSQGVKGGQGQDFTLNWFMRGGIEHITSRRTHLSAGIMYQHMSNGGMTNPNPGIDALGFTLGYAWKF
jgi:lipid A 3-O-deacylase